MNEYRDWWPQGCQKTGYTAGSRNVYIDIKPLGSGDMGLGLYVDSACTQSYTGKSVKLENLIDEFAGSTLDDHIEAWNKALGVFKQCQPCKAYDLSSTGEDENGLFSCNDKAGYTNVNQCMKFRAKTKMLKATFHDIELATRERTITETYSYSASESLVASWGFFGVSAAVFLVGLIFCIVSAKPKRRRTVYSQQSKKPNSEPLLSSVRSKSSSGRLSPNSTRLDTVST
jgi:hypothetical protein